MGFLPHLKYLNTLLWSPKPKLKIWIRSDKWLMSYNPFQRRLGGCSPAHAVQVRLYNHPIGWVFPLGRVWQKCL
jgi:hypothetical protein